MRRTHIPRCGFSYQAEVCGTPRLQTCTAFFTRHDRPVYGVIFLFKYPTGEKPSDVPRDGAFDFDAAEDIFFAGQTIQNACGTQALLSVLLNKEGQVDIGSQLQEFKDFTRAFPSEVQELPENCT